MRGPRPTHLSAAVIEDQDAPVARVVPKGAKKLKVGGLTLGYSHKSARISARPGEPFSMARQRLAEEEALIAYRHGGPCDTDDGEAYLRAALPHILALPLTAATPMHRTNAILWANRWVPRILDEVTLEWLDNLEHEYATRPRLLRADTLAKMLGVTKAERDALGLTTIGAVDWNKRQRGEARKKRKAARQRAKRAASPNYTPREQSAAKTEPWISAGFNTRRTWERHGKPAPVAIPCPSSEATKTADVASSCPPIERSSTSCPRNRDTVSRPITQCDGRQTVGLAGDANPRSAAPVTFVSAQLSDAIQFTFSALPQAENELVAASDAWIFGPMPETIEATYIASKNAGRIVGWTSSERFGSAGQSWRIPWRARLIPAGQRSSV
jgi:hypothetical protein